MLMDLGDIWNVESIFKVSTWSGTQERGLEIITVHRGSKDRER